MEKLVSVIITAYNCELYIKEAIQSVLNQTYQNVQIIVVDDGSSDDTVKIAENALKDKNEELKLIITKINGGEASARNHGLEFVKGYYVALLDGDDIMRPERISVSVSSLENNAEYSMVYGKFSFLIESDHISKWNKWQSVGNNGSGDIFVKQFINNQINLNTVLLKKECFDKVGIFDETVNLASDSDMWIRVSAEYKVLYLDYCMAYYRLHSFNTTLNRIECLQHRYNSLKKIFYKYKEKLKKEHLAINIIRNLNFKLMKIYLKKYEFKKFILIVNDYLRFKKLAK
jgi:glycosyltransferase involved in cell wall biosynthesis